MKLRNLLVTLLFVTIILCLGACAVNYSDTEVCDHFYRKTVGQAATCINPGTNIYTCSKCNETRTETTPVGEHKYTSRITTQSTCTTEGVKTYTCSVCQGQYTASISKSNHSYTSKVTTAATCASTGVRTYTCSGCQYSYTESIAKTSHSYTSKVTTAATCTSTGVRTYTCSGCKTSYTESIAKRSSHEYVSGVCKYCNASDPNYTPTFTNGQTWTVNGQWELSFKDAYITANKNGKTTVQVSWQYKNIGYNGKLDIGLYEFDVYDGEMEKAASTYYDVDYSNPSGADCIVGAKATCTMGWILNNSSSSITIYVELRDSNGVTRSAFFKVNVKPLEEQPEEDRLNGCTITCQTSLPKTLYYYSYSGSISSGCSVTDVSFEVSGDDLYIYFTGKKTYDANGSGQSASCKISWKLYDSKNNVVDAGTAYTVSLATGEGFLNTRAIAYNCITPGETYYIVLLNTN